MKCCGSYGPQDYADSWFANQTGNPSVPDSCCVMKHDKPVDLTKCHADAESSATHSDYLHTKVRTLIPFCQFLG